MSNKIMRAYHNDPVIKAGILARLQAHYDADEIVKGHYWENGTGCAVGCTVHSGEHAEYEPRFGIPRGLARLEDTIFEHLPNSDAMGWPLRFMNAIAPGADLSRVWPEFLRWMLHSIALPSAGPDEAAEAAILDTIAVFDNWLATGTVDESMARAASSAANSAEYGAANRAANRAARAAYRAANHAEYGAAYRAADSAADSAAYSAANSEAWSAAWGEAHNAAHSEAYNAAYAAAWSAMADKLLALIEAK